jgi:hypothetical protein
VVSMSYETALICLNGHVITIGLESSPEKYAKHCVRCGERTISECPNCHSKIRGYYRSEGVVVATHYTVPLFCHDCGKPYPWTETKLNAVHKLIDENRKLKSSEKEDLKKSIEALVKESPTKDLAIDVSKRLIPKMGNESVEILKAILIELLSEAVKRKLFQTL